MAIRTYLQGLGATHLFDLDNNGTLTTDDLGNSSTPTNISGGTYTFDTDPVCEGVTYSLDVVANTSSGTDGAIFTNVSGINTGITGWSSDKRSLLIWCKQADIQNPTCIYEQGGGVNNFALMGGALATFQAADSGQPFLIVQAKSLTQSDRPYCLVGVWEYHTQHAGSGNRILFYINGILQGISELTGTDSFPSHGGDIQCGNSGENLQSFAGTVFTSQTTEKNCNFLGMFNNVSLTQAQCREIFERTTFAKQTIVADTVANQQAALDAIIGTTYENENCAIRIIQATDATNYRLFIDNITFNADPNLEDISIQFVGTGTLTVENTNGTVIKYTSTPTEVETTSTTYTGGGSIVVVNNTKRVKTDQTITNPLDDKIVFDGSGSSYTIDGGIVPVIENVSGNTVTVSLINGAPTPTLLETDGSFIVEQSVNITAPNIIDGSRVQIYNVTKSAEIDNSVVSGGLGYSTSVNLLSASVDDGDTIRLRATYTSGTSAKSEALATGIIGTNGLSFLTTQDNDDAYNTLALDGSTITKFTADYVNDEVDISVASDFTLAEFYAWWVYNTTTSQGISEFFGGVTAVDEANFRINNSVVNIYFDNATATNISQTDNRRVYRENGVRPVVNSTSGGGGIDVEWRSPVTIAASESIQSNLTDILDDTDELQQNQGDWLTATGFSTFDPSSDQVIVATNNDKTGYSISGTKNTLDDLNDASASDVYIEFTTGSNEDVFKADVSNLDVAVSTRNSVAPDNAGITANGNAISALNNFDPASDQVIVATNNDKINYSLTTADKDDIVDRNWNEPHDQHKTAGTFGWLMDLLRKANRAIEGEVTGTPTTTSFTSNITGYVTGAFDSEVLVFVSGTINGEARPILDYDSTNGTFNFEEAWTQAPSSSDEFVILPYHVHAISEIQEGLATRNNQNTINENVKKSSKLIPASGNLPDN